MAEISSKAFNHKLEELFSRLGAGLALCEIDGAGSLHIVSANERLGQLEEVAPASMAGKRASAALGVTQPGDLKSALATLSGSESPVWLEPKTIVHRGLKERREIVLIPEEGSSVLLLLIAESEVFSGQEETRGSILRSIFDSVYDAIFLHRSDGSIVAVNQRVLELYGISTEEALSASISDDLSGRGAPVAELPDRWAAVMAGKPQLFRWSARRPPNGQEFTAEVYLTRLPLPDEPLIMATVRDTSQEVLLAEELEASRRRFEEIALISADWIWETDAEGRFIYVSERVREFLGYEPDELVGRSALDLMAPEERAAVETRMRRVRDERSSVRDAEERYRRKDGSLGYALSNVIPRVSPEGEFQGFLGIAKDISEQKEREHELHLYKMAFQSAIEGFVITDPEGTIVAVNPAFTRITGYLPAEAIGQNPRILKSEKHEPSFYTEMWRAILEDGAWTGEIWNRKKDGEAYPERLSISAIRDSHGTIRHFVAVFHDISEMKSKEEQIRHQALHDSLTGIPNRALLMDRAEQALGQASREGGTVSLLFFDLDNFKNINDSLGHSCGDLLLQQVADRLHPLLRKSDTFSRIGGDEFVILMHSDRELRTTVRVTERVLQALSEPFQIEGQILRISASVGISSYPADGDDPETLIKNADLAMYEAKERGKATYHLYTEHLDSMVSERIGMEHRLREAIENEELTVRYQPRVGKDGKQVLGVEALARWNDGGENIAPDRFIEIAETSGLVASLDSLIISKACRQLLDSKISDQIRLSVNVSSGYLHQPDAADRILSSIGNQGFPPERLEVEITETTAMSRIDSTIEQLSILADAGIRISVDDFGTGYSSLLYLKELPIHVLKIDRSFVKNLPDNEHDAEITSTIIAMARNLSLSVVAEGVESEAHLRFLQNRECDEFQGYFFSRPISITELEHFLRP